MTSVIIPTWVLEADVSDRALRLYAAIRRLADAHNLTPRPSRRYLADKCKCSPSSVDRALDELERIGALTVTQRRGPSGQEANVYTIEAAGSVQR